jgi:hypothetical protein
MSLITPIILLTTPSSSTFFPKSSLFPDLLIMYLAMAEDSVNLKSPSIRYGRLGKSNPIVFLSPSNHF